MHRSNAAAVLQEKVKSYTDMHQMHPYYNTKVKVRNKKKTDKIVTFFSVLLDIKCPNRGCTPSDGAPPSVLTIHSEVQNTTSCTG